MSKKILICDDEEGIRESLKLILADHYELILTDNGEQCLECIENCEDIGLVLLDIKMPKMHGLDLLKAIKEKHPDLNAVMITGYKSVETASEATNSLMPLPRMRDAKNINEPVVRVHGPKRWPRYSYTVVTRLP